MEKIHKEIEKKIGKMRKGRLLFLSDFRGTGSEGAIKMTLSRLARAGKVKRTAHGIYVVPEIDPVLGEILPSMEKIANAVAQKNHIRIRPAGAYALHKLGLTTQVPMKLVYLTDGPLRQIRVGKTVIRFKPTTPKKLSLQGELTSLIIPALEELGTDNMDPVIKEKIRKLLLKEDPQKRMKDIKLASGRVSDFLVKLLKESRCD